MKLFKFLLVGLLFVSLMGCNEQGELDSSRGNTNEAEAATTVAPVVQSNPIDISALGEHRVVSLKTSVTDPQHLPITLEQVVSLSKDCQDPTIIDPDDLTFSIDNSDPERCFYQYTVKNHTGDPALDKTATATSYVLASNEKRLPPISEVTTVGEPLTIDLEAQLGSDYPDGYVLDEEVIVFTGSGEVIANTSTNSINFIPDEKGTSTLSYTLNDPNGTGSEMGFIYISVSGPGNTAPAAENFMGPQNIEPGESLIVDVAGYISDPDGDELNLVDVNAFSAEVDIIDNPNGNNTEFSFVGDKPEVYNVRYTVSDNRGGEAGAFVTIVIPARTLLPWDDIFFNNVLVYTAPWEKEVADGENIGYTTTQKEWVDGTEYDIALFDYDNAVFTCERYGMELPTEGQLLDLFNHFNSQGINIQDADGNAWPVGANYVSSDSNVSVNLFNGDVNDSESPDTPLMLTCAFPSLLQVTVTTDSAYVLENGETPESDNYNLVQATVFNSSGLPDEGEAVFISSSESSLIFTTSTGTTDDNGEVIFSVASSAAGDFDVTVSYMEQSIPVTVTFLEDEVISLDISGPNEVVIGEPIQLMAETTDSQGNVVDVTSSATWSSDDPSIASVNAGSVLGVSLGEASVSAEYVGVDSNKMTITVVDSFGEDGYIEVTPESVNLDTEENNTKEFSATLYSTAYPDGKDITSDPATTWQVTDGDGVVGSLNENVFTASGAGFATVEAQYEILETGEIASDTAEITVIDPEPTPVSLEIIGSNSLRVGDTEQYTAIITFDDGSTQDVTDESEWLKDDSNVLSLSDEAVSKGYAVAQEEGNAIVAVKYSISPDDVMSDALPVTVSGFAPTLESLTIEDAPQVMVVGESQQLKAIASYSDGSTSDVAAEASWSSDSAAISVNATGNISAESVGEATVSVNFDGLEDSVDVFVDSSRPVSIEIQGRETLNVGDEEQYTAIATYTDDSTKEVTSLSEWGVSDDTVLDVSDESGSKGYATALTPGKEIIAVTYNGESSILWVEVEAAPVTEERIEIRQVAGLPVTDTMTVGDTQNLEAILIYSDNTEKDVTDETTWSSVPESVLTVDASGVAQAESEGDATVSAMYNQLTDSVNITVEAAPVTEERIEIRQEAGLPVTDTMTVGDPQNLEAILIYSDNTEKDVTDETTWSSVPESVLTVDASGVAQAKSEGDATVSAAYNLLTDSVNITVEAAPVTEERIEIRQVAGLPVTDTMTVGDPQNLEAILIYSDNTEKDVTDETTWSSVPESVLTVDASGVAQAKSEGDATVSASYNLLTDSVNITVEAAPVTEERIEIRQVAGLPVTDTMTVGDPQNLEAILIYSDNTEKDVTDETTWSSVPESVLTVDASGVAQAESEGDATVSAMYNQLNDSVGITVEAVSGPVFEIEGPTEVVVNDHIHLVAKLDGEAQTNPPGSYTVIGWSSSNPEIASVDTGGYVTGEATGTVTITATLKDESIGVEPATYDVTVTPEPWGGDYMEIIPESATLDVGGSQAFTAKLYTEESPNGVEFTDAIWTLNEPNGDIGDLSGEDGNVFIATNAGSGSIMATLYTSPFDTITATADIIVEEAATTDYLEIEGENEVVVDEDITLELILHFSGGEVTLEDSAVEWSSSDESIATVDSIGLVTGIKEGTVIITGAFTNSGLEPATHEVTVTSEPWGGDYMEIIPESATLDVGDSQAFTAKIYSAEYPDGAETTRVAWTLNEPNGDIGDLSGEDGNVFTGTNAGSGSITATWYSGSSKVTETASIIVVGDSAPTLTSVEITNPIDSLKVDNTYQYEAVANYSDGSRVDITGNATWTANPNTIAKFSYEGAEPGVVTGLKEGTTTLKVTYSEGGVTKDDTTPLEVTEGAATVTSFEIREAPATLEIGSTDNLEAWVIYSDGTSTKVTVQTDWVTKNPNRISVNSTTDKGLIEALGSPGYSATIEATYGELKDSVSITVTEAAITLTSVEITNAIDSLNIDKTYQYEAVANYSDGSSVDITSNATWTSEYNDVATFEGAEPGVVTAVEEGNTTISVTYSENGVEKVDSAPLEVTVTLPALVDVEVRGKDTLEVGEFAQYTAWAIYSDDSEVQVTLDSEWEGQPPSKITVSNDAALKGLAEALSTSSGALVKAIYKGVSYGKIVEINAPDVSVTSFEIREAPESLAIGSPDNLEAWVIYSDGTSTEVTVQTDWESKNPNRISVNNTTDKGLIEALGSPGYSATIEATYGEFKDSVSIKVTEGAAVVTGLEIREAPESLAVGDTDNLEAWAVYDDGTSTKVTNESEWQSLNTKRISVNNTDNKGFIEVLGSAGTYGDIKASYGGLSDTVRIDIEADAPTLTSVEITNTAADGSDNIKVGDTYGYKAKAYYSDGTNTDITNNATWTSSDSSVAKFSYQGAEPGVVTGLDVGNTTVKVTYSEGGVTKEETTPLEVTEGAATMTSFEIRDNPESLAIGVTDNLTAWVVYSDGTSTEVTDESEWGSQNPNRISVNNTNDKGLIEALDSAGTDAKLEASYGEFKDVITIRVTDAPATMTALEIREAPESLAVGDTDNLEAWAVYDDGTSTKVTNESEWQSLNTKRISVNNTDNKGFIEVLGSAGTYGDIKASYGGLSDTARIDIEADAPTVTSVEITNTAADGSDNIKVGDTYGYKAKAYYSDGTNTDITNNATWTSSDSSVAKFSYQGAEPGVVTGLDVGNTTVKVTYSEDGVTKDDTTSLEVTEGAATVISFEIRDNPESLAIGETDNLTAWVVYSDGTSTKVTDESEWESLNAQRISVNNTNDKGLIEALGSAGYSGSIKATYGEFSDSVSIDIESPVPTKQLIIKGPDTIISGNDKAYTYTAWFVNSNGNETEVTLNSQWTGAPEDVVAVANYNNLKGKTFAGLPGNGTVTAKYNGMEASKSVEVVEPEFVSIKISNPKSVLYIGDTHRYQAKAVYNNGYEVNITASWTSSNSSIAGFIDSAGTIKGYNEGSVTVTASYEGETATTNLTVKKEVVSTMYGVLQHRQIQTTGCVQNVVSSQRLPVTSTTINNSLQTMPPSCEGRPTNYIDFDVVGSGSVHDGSITSKPSYMGYEKDGMAKDSVYCKSRGSGEKVVFRLPNGVSYSTKVVCN